MKSGPSWSQRTHRHNRNGRSNLVLNPVLAVVSLVLLSSMDLYLQPRGKRYLSSFWVEAKGLSRLPRCIKGTADWTRAPWHSDIHAFLCREMVTHQCWSLWETVRASPFWPPPGLTPSGYTTTKQQSLQQYIGVQLFMIYFKEVFHNLRTPMDRSLVPSVYRRDRLPSSRPRHNVKEPGHLTTSLNR